MSLYPIQHAIGMLWQMRAVRENTMQRVRPVVMGFRGTEWPTTILLPVATTKHKRIHDVARAMRFLHAEGHDGVVFLTDGYHRVRYDNSPPSADCEVRDDPVASESFLAYVFDGDDQPYELSWDYAPGDRGGLEFKTPAPVYEELRTSLGIAIEEEVAAAQDAPSTEDLAKEGYSVLAI